MRHRFGFFLAFHLLINGLGALKSAGGSAANAVVRRYIQISPKEASPAIWPLSLTQHCLSEL